MPSPTAGRLLINGDFSSLDIAHTVNGVTGAGSAVALLNAFISTVIPRLIYIQNYAGAYKIAGIVQVNGQGTQGRVLLMPQGAPSIILREANTLSDGVFAFTNLAPGRYIAWAMTDDGSRDVVAHEYVLALPMN